MSLAAAFTTHRVTVFGVDTSGFIASANFASINVQSIVIGLALVTLQTRDTCLARAFAGGITLLVERAEWVTVAINALVIFASIEVNLAVLAMRTVRISLTFNAMATVSSGVVEVLIKVAFVRQTVAVASY